MRKHSIKNTRINGEVQRELANIIRGEIKDPRIHPMTSVVAVLGNEQAQQDTIAGLKSAEGFIRRKLAHTINLRNTPEIRFVLDQSIEYGVSMSKLIDDVNSHSEKREDEHED